MFERLKVCSSLSIKKRKETKSTPLLPSGTALDATPTSVSLSHQILRTQVSPSASSLLHRVNPGSALLMLDYFLVTSSYIQSILAAFQVHSPWPSGYLMALTVPPLVVTAFYFKSRVYSSPLPASLSQKHSPSPTPPTPTLTIFVKMLTPARTTV